MSVHNQEVFDKAVLAACKFSKNLKQFNEDIDRVPCLHLAYAFTPNNLAAAANSCSVLERSIVQSLVRLEERQLVSLEMYTAILFTWNGGERRCFLNQKAKKYAPVIYINMAEVQSLCRFADNTGWRKIAFLIAAIITLGIGVVLRIMPVSLTKY